MPPPHPLPFRRGISGPPLVLPPLQPGHGIGHPVSGTNTTDFIRPIQTCFRCGSRPEVLNLASYIHSPDHSTKGTRSPVDGLSVLVSTRFQVLFHSPTRSFHLSFTVLYFIGHWVVFRLGGASPSSTGFHVSRGLWIQLANPGFHLRGSHTLWLAFPHHSVIRHRTYKLPKPRRYFYPRFGLFRVRSPLLAESRLIYLPRPT